MSDPRASPLLHECPICRTGWHVRVEFHELGHDFKAIIIYTCYECGSRWIKNAKVIMHPSITREYEA